MIETGDEKLDGPLLRLMAVMLLGGLMGLLDATIVNVGVDTLTGALDAPLATIEWVATGYLLAFAVAVPVAGWAVDRFGSRRTWLTGLAIFVVGSALSSLAWSGPVLVGFRVLQGLGAGMLEPTLLTVLARAAGPRRAGRMMGLVGITIPLAPIFGPVLGGVIIEYLDWRWMFLVNLPVGVVAFLLAVRVLPADPPVTGTPPPLDLVGVALLSPGFAALVYALAEAGTGGFGEPPVVVALLLGAGLLTGYVLHALRVPAPLLDVRLFAGRGFAASVTVMFLIGGALFSLLFLLPLYYQQVHGHGGLAAGLLLVPQGVGAFLGMPLAGRLSDRLGARSLVPVGALLAVAGSLAYTRSDDGTSLVWLAACSMVTGLGFGFIGAPTMSSVYRTVPPGSVPSATGAIYILNQIGASLGVAVVVFILARAQYGPASAAGAFHPAFWWAVAAGLVITVVGLALPGRPAPVTTALPHPGEEPVRV